MTVVWSCGCGRRVLTVDARYDAVADFYAAGWPDSGDDPVALALLSLSGDVAGEQILDLACGHGRITRQLAGRGASVTGIDISAALIAKAIDAERCQPGGIRYLQADAAAADWLPGHAVRRSRLQLRAIRHRRFGRRSRCCRPGDEGRRPVPTTTRDGGGQPGRHLAQAAGRGEPPDPVHLPQRAAAARPMAGRSPRASPATRMGARSARRRPHARLPGSTMPPAITAKAAATFGHSRVAGRVRPGAGQSRSGRIRRSLGTSSLSAA